jgi:hypothetical protein
MKNKLAVLVALIFCVSVTASAGTRNSYQVPVNQTGAADTYALPCTPSALIGTAATAVTVYGVGKSTPLAEAGMVYWIAITPETAGDYVVLRDSATANSTSTAFLTVEAPTITATTLIQFNPPIAVTNGLSINQSSGTTNVTVCVRAADGDL